MAFYCNGSKDKSTTVLYNFGKNWMILWPITPRMSITNIYVQYVIPA